MLFNSYEFIFIYLPIVLIGYFAIGRANTRLAELWIAAASLFFYGWWNPKFVLLLLTSITVNFLMGDFISRIASISIKRNVFALSIALNLGLLFFYKYTNFFIEAVGEFGPEIEKIEIILPLGISFFTFTQIAYLVDVYRGVAREANYVHYVLFVTWFPHLIAGPVLHHKQMMPQFADKNSYAINYRSIEVGLTIFTIGLFKKVVLADQFAVYANPIFDSANTGVKPMFLAAWGGSLAYTLQLYFDFSGYSDMAIGLSRMFNVSLPINFDSPYKAKNIIDFWRRWHITLSTFLRDYLYIPLGGNQKGKLRRYLNLFLTMLLGGLWHGAGWGFILWGSLHGIYLIINHGWQHISKRFEFKFTKAYTLLSLAITFVGVVVAWIPFRAASLNVTLLVWKGMAGLNGISFPEELSIYFGKYFGEVVQFNGMSPGLNLDAKGMIAWLFVGLTAVWFLPNTQEWVGNSYESEAERHVLIVKKWKPNLVHAMLLGFVFCGCIIALSRITEFLYFQF